MAEIAPATGKAVLVSDVQAGTVEIDFRAGTVTARGWVFPPDAPEEAKQDLLREFTYGALLALDQETAPAIIIEGDGVGT